MNNYYVTSQLVAQHQADLAADATHRAQLKTAYDARENHPATAGRPARIRRLFVPRPASASA
jgi:hypothetical protein